MNVVCPSDNCAFTVNAKCVFYESSALPNTGIATNDSLQVALQKIDAFVATIGGGDVESVNGQTGVVVLTAGDVGAVAPGANISGFTNDSGYITGAIADGDYWKITGTTVTNNPIISVENDGTVEKKVEITSALTGSPTNNVKLIIGNLDDGLGGFIPTFQLQANEDATSGTLIQAADRNLFLITFSGGITNTLKISPTGSLIDKIIDYTSDVSGTYTDRSLADWGTIRGAKTFTGAQTFRAGTATAGTAPVYFQSGVALTAPADGAMEYHSSHLYFTIGGTRYQLDQQGGGITNTAAANELMKSDGTNAVPSGLFSTVAGDLTFGTGLIGATRNLVAEGSAVDVGLDLTTKGTGNLTLTVNGSTAVLSTNDFRITLPSTMFGIDGNVYGSNRTSSSTTIEAGFKITHLTSIVPVAGIGVSLEFKVETSASNIEIGARIEAVTTDVTLGSEDFDLVFRTMAAGAAATEALKISSTGNLTIGAGKAAGTRSITSSGGGLTLLTSSSGNLTLNCGLGSYSQSGTTGYATIYSGGSSTPGSRTLTVNEFIAAAGATIQYPFRIEASTNSGWAAGRGVGMEFFMDTGGANVEIGGIIEVVSTDLTAASEDFDMVVKIMAAGAAATEKLRIKGNSGAAITLYQVNNGSAYSITNGVTDRTYDANATTLDELADIVYTLIQDLKLTNIIA